MMRMTKMRARTLTRICRVKKTSPTKTCQMRKVDAEHVLGSVTLQQICERSRLTNILNVNQRCSLRQ